MRRSSSLCLIDSISAFKALSPLMKLDKSFHRFCSDHWIGVFYFLFCFPRKIRHHKNHWNGSSEIASYSSFSRDSNEF